MDFDCEDLGGSDSAPGMFGLGSCDPPDCFSGNIPTVGNCYFTSQSGLEDAIRQVGDQLEDQICEYLSDVGCTLWPDCCGMVRTNRSRQTTLAANCPTHCPVYRSWKNVCNLTWRTRKMSQML